MLSFLALFSIYVWSQVADQKSKIMSFGVYHGERLFRRDMPSEGPQIIYICGSVFTSLARKYYETPAKMATPKPTAIVCVGMAGSGKTTFMQRINSHLHSQRQPPYVINLDPAVVNVPFESNIDIRDSVC
jgi:polynucleotide 5'-kinase involved in rRNA processing